jgi:hypothetical protein
MNHHRPVTIPVTMMAWQSSGQLRRWCMSYRRANDDHLDLSQSGWLVMVDTGTCTPIKLTYLYQATEIQGIGWNTPRKPV